VDLWRLIYRVSKSMFFTIVNDGWLMLTVSTLVRYQWWNLVTWCNMYIHQPKIGDFFGRYLRYLSFTMLTPPKWWFIAILMGYKWGFISWDYGMLVNPRLFDATMGFYETRLPQEYHQWFGGRHGERWGERFQELQKTTLWWSVPLNIWDANLS
jgi:hypothetical protein